MISNLLNQIIEKHQDSASDPTSFYNIFQVLQLESEEVRLHSRFLADLLNPRGNHGLGAFFLERFLNLVPQNTIFPNLKQVELYVEKHIGPVTPTTGGQIDLLLQDNHDNALIIENKIYAGDQENQLLRYYNFGKQLETRGGKTHILYLTLHGTKASDFSLGCTPNHEIYTCLSYKYDVLNWLEDCAQELTENSKISVILFHYNQLIKRLTNMENQDHEITMNEILQSQDKFAAAVRISEALLPAKCRLLKNGIQEVVTKLQKSFPNLTFDVSDHFGHKYHGLEIHHANFTTTEQSSHIRFSFLSDASDCYIEIHPGLKNGVSIDKNHAKRLDYITNLNPHFPNTTAKVLNTENYWQGEWVAHYYVYNDIFEQLLDEENRVVLLNTVTNDLSRIITEFQKIELNYQV